jgi:tRNA pseudouridine(55) synthase
MTNNLAKDLNSVLNLYKNKSETPLQTIERYVSTHPEFRGVKMTYAGRLDPMAEGVLIVLTGEKNKEREAYTGLDKDYEFEFILGLETDTHDVLGKITETKQPKVISEKDIQNALKKFTGKFKQKYPAYSSKVVGGVPLFDLARKGKLATVVMPDHEVEVKKIELVETKQITKADFKKQIEKDINAVTGDFRQKEILKVWNEYLENDAPEILTIYKGKVTSGSGFYVRQLVSDIGRDIGTGAITTSIKRTRVGSFTLVR